MTACFCSFAADNAYIMVPPKNTTQPEGTRVSLTCQAEADPNNITYHWSQNGVDVYLVTGLMNNRAGIYADGSFIITSARREDTGWYQCQPSNGFGQAPTAQAFLNITCKNKVVYILVMLSIWTKCLQYVLT